jgi:hypothetical protein
MTCEENKLLLADYWSRTLSAAQDLGFETHLAACETCRREADRLGTLWRNLGAAAPAEEPADAVRSRFYETLAAYRDGAAAGGWNWFWKIAAGVALLLGGAALGYSWHLSQAASAEVIQLRQLVALSLLQQQSASERLRGVSWAYQVEPQDTEVLTALLAAVNHDPNVNVRLAAVDALRPFASSPGARDAAIQSLSQQTSPIVQVALIDLLVDLKERNAKQALRSVASDASADAEVRKRAHWALESLE